MSSSKKSQDRLKKRGEKERKEEEAATPLAAVEEVGAASLTATTTSSPAAPTPVAASSTRSYESGSSLRSMVYLMAHQLFTRIGTFVLNIMVARHIGPVAYGLSAVHLYLLNTMILFICREAIRRATLRYAAPNTLTPTQSTAYERIILINLSWISIVASIPLCALFRYFFIYSAPIFTASLTATTDELSSEYTYCITLYTLASFIELVSEPLYILFQKHQRVRSRVMIDAVAVLVRCVVTFVCMKFGTQTAGGLLPFAYGQLVFASILVLGYYGSSCYEIWRNRSSPSDCSGIFTQLSDLLPQRLPETPSLSSYTDPALLRLTTQLTYQSLEKFALTEGEKLVLVSLNSNLDTQGIYGLIQNLGSLIARMIFQPLEESAFMEFSLLFAPLTSEREKKELAKTEENSNSNSSTAASVESVAATAASYSSGVSMLGILLHFVLLLGLLLLCFGPAYSHVFLDLLYGTKWSSTTAPTILSYYCVYILFMALNGVTEAFLSAVISTKQLKRYNIWLIVFSVIYLCACALLLPWGSAGLIAANCINMSLRIAYSSWFILRFFGQTSDEVNQSHDCSATSPTLLTRLYHHLLPDRFTCLTFLLSLIITNLSYYAWQIEGSHSLPRFGAHVGVGLICLLMVGGTIWKRERAFLQELKGLARSRKRKAS